MRARPASRLVAPRYEPRLRLGSPRLASPRRSQDVGDHVVTEIFDHVAERCNGRYRERNEICTYISLGSSRAPFCTPVFAHFTVSRSRTRDTNFSLDRNSFLETNEKERSRTLEEQKGRQMDVQRRKRIRIKRCVYRAQFDKKNICICTIVAKVVMLRGINCKTWCGQTI